MKSLTKLAIAALGAVLFAPVYNMATASPAPAAARGEHPAYLHALSDLRDARAHLERPGGGERKEQERKAIEEIDAAIFEIKKASIDDGKNINDHVPVDSRLDWPGRLHRAVELLDKAHSDVSREEDNRFAEGLQSRAIEHIDRAHHHVEEAIHDVR
jgi:hypothetical protein